MLQDYLGYILGNLAHRKMRSWLTMIGIFIGIAAVVALISLGQGLNEAINEQFQQLGAETITVSSASSGFAGGPIASALSSSPLTEQDLKAVRSVRGVFAASAIMMKSAQVKFREQSKELIVVGVPVDAESKRLFSGIQPVQAELGRDLRSSDKFKTLLRYGVAHDVFEKDVALQAAIAINGQPFQVVGIVKRIGNQFADRSVLVPIDTARELFNEPKLVSIIIVKADKGEDVAAVGDRIRRELRRARGEKEGEETFEVQTSEQLRESFGSILLIVQAVLIGIASISLFVGGIGIMNTMYTAVLERTKEIGIMKAVGAKNSDILSIFILESGMLGLIGGIIGISLGMGISKMVEIGATAALGTTLLKAYFPWYLILGALMFSFIVGALSGALPAVQASKLRPVDALRYE